MAKLAALGPLLAKLGHWPNFASPKPGQIRYYAEIGRTLDQLQPKMTEFGQDIAEVGPSQAKFGPSWAKLGQF